MKPHRDKKITEKIEDEELRELLMDPEMKNKIKQIYKSIFSFTEFANLNYKNSEKSKQKKYNQDRKMNKSRMESPEYDGLCGMRRMNGYDDEMDQDEYDMEPQMTQMHYMRSRYDGLDTSAPATEGACATKRRSPAKRGSATRKTAARKAVATRRRKSTAAKSLKTKTTARRSPKRRSPSKTEMRGYDGLSTVDALVNATEGACARRKSTRRGSAGRSSTNQDRSKRAKAAWKPGGYLYEANKKRISRGNGKKKTTRRSSGGKRKTGGRRMGGYDGLEAPTTEGACARNYQKTARSRKSTLSRKSQGQGMMGAQSRRRTQVSSDVQSEQLPSVMRRMYGYDGLEATEGACARRRRSPGRPRGSKNTK